MVRRRVLAVLLPLALLTSVIVAAPVALAQDDANVFYTGLSGAAEVPDVDTEAFGAAGFRLNDAETELDFLVVTHGLSDVTQAHIHTGGPGENGPVVVFLFGFVDDGVTRNGILSRGTISESELLGITMADLVTALRDGDAYVNVHTVANPGGEIRGQIRGIVPPAGGKFTDTTSNPHAANIELIGAAGISKGCNPPDNDEFCPTDALTRGEMAALFRRAFAIPDSDTDFFTDDDGSTFEADINAIAEAGVTKGCNPPDNDEFCPDDTLTRAHLAAFLARFLSLTVPADVDFFTDDDGSIFEDLIEALRLSGITVGKTATTFDPSADVTRDQAASFLARALGWHSLSVPEGVTLTFLHNNDGESELLGDGDFGGAARFVALVDQLKALAAAETDGVLLLSSGDNFLAGPEWSASLDKGVPFYDSIVLSAAGYDAIALGNHDFDFGPDVLAELISGVASPAVAGLLPQALFEAPPFLSSNLDFSGEPNLLALFDQGRIAPSTLVTVDGVSVGIVGATTPDLPFISSPRDVVVDPDVAANVQAEIDELLADGADIIVLISHLQSVNEDLALAPNLSGVDIMIAGGGDELLANPGDLLVDGDTIDDAFGPYPLWAINRDGEQIPVVTTSGQYFYLGRLIATFDAAGDFLSVDTDSGLVRVSGVAPDAVTPDPAIVSSVEDPITAFVADLATTVIGTSEVDLNGVREDVRTMETNEGNLIADALLWQATELAAGFGVPVPDVAMQNGGGIRNDSVIPAGDITELDTFDMLPFPNFVTIIEDISREQFKEILENAVSQWEDTDGRFAQVAGFSFTWDLNGTPQELDEDGNVVTPGTRVTEVTLDDSTVIVTGGAVVAGDPLTVATIDFLARGGDQYPFRDAPFTAVGVSYQQALSDFIELELMGTITAADYPVGGEGRITGLNLP